MTRQLEILERGLRGLRMRQIRSILASGLEAIPGAQATLPLLRDSLRVRQGGARACLLDSPALGGWLQDVLFWRKALEGSARLLAGDGSRSGQGRLFELMARTEFLVETLPSGRLDAGFPRRVRRRAISVLRDRLCDLPRILWPHLPLRDDSLLPFLLAENPDEGCPAGRIRLGMTPAVLVWTGANPPRRLIARVAGGALAFSSPVELRVHETIPKTSMLLSHRLVSRAGSLRVGPGVPGLGKRLSRALALVDAAWPGAGEEIRRRTWLVVPLVERGTVSYSYLARPGISYINVFRGTLVDLSDDLLHETAHHRLHALQELAPLARDEGEPRYSSPWRRGLRPLNGILHGTYTFLFRVELLLRLVQAGIPLPRARRVRLRSEAMRELERCGRSLQDLAAARKEGLLTPAGRLLAGEMACRLALLQGGRLSDADRFSIF